MKQAERNEKSKQKIIEFALQEFGEKGYEQSSINTICQSGSISKGILYHYYTDKDSLYLECIQNCFNDLTLTLENYAPSKDQLKAEEILEEYFLIRYRFFVENPNYQRLFLESMLTPIHHLTDKIEDIKQPFYSISQVILMNVLNRIQLRKDITLKDSIETFKLYQDFVNARQSKQYKQSLTSLEEHESICKKSVQILLYGVIER